MPASVICPTCGHLWPWNATTAGRQARCRCGGLMTFPAAAPVVAVDEPVAPAAEDPWSQPFADVGIEPAADVGDILPLPIPLAVVPPPVKPRKARLSGTLPYRSLGSFDANAPAPFDRKKGLLIGSPGRDFWLPLILIIIGVLLYVARTVRLIVTWPTGLGTLSATTILASLASTAIIILVNGIVAVFVILIFRRMMDLDFGSSLGTVLKMAAISIFPQSVASTAFLFSGDCAGLLLSFPLGVVIMVSLFSGFFAVGLSESMICVLTVTVLEVFSWMYAAPFLDKLFR